MSDDIQNQIKVPEPAPDMKVCDSAQTDDVQDLNEQLAKALYSRDWYKHRCNNLQAAQKNMRDPERTMVCDILANGALLHDGSGLVAAARYAVKEEHLASEGQKVIADSSELLSIEGNRRVLALMRRAMEHPEVLEIMADCSDAIETEGSAVEGSDFDRAPWVALRKNLRDKAKEIRDSDPEIWEAETHASVQGLKLLNQDEVRNIFLAHGFTVKEGQSDLKPYVFEAAKALMQAMIKNN